MENDIQTNLAKPQPSTGWREHHRLTLLIGLAIVVALLLVMVSLRLYNSSGAAQLDLSRPGYSAVREQVGTAEKFNAFPSNGALSSSTLQEFKVLYDQQAEKATEIDAFSGDVLSDAALGIDAPAVEGNESQ